MLISTHALNATLPVTFSPASWTQVADSTFGISNINAVTFNGVDQYVAVGSSGKLATSEDGITWVSQDSGFSGSNIYSVAYGDGIYVIGGSAGKIATSIDGITWTLQSSSFGASTVLGITYSELANLWVAVGGSGKLATSIDGLTWVQRTSSFGTTFINSVYSGPGFLVAVGYDGKLATSTNGVAWTQRSSSFISSIIYSVSSAYILFDSNPLDGVPASLMEVYFAVGDSGKVAYSTNGTSWTQIYPASSFGSSSIRTIVALDSYIIAGSSAGKIGTTYSGLSWDQRVSSFGLTNINSITASTGFAVAVGNSGKIAYSGENI